MTRLMSLALKPNLYFLITFSHLFGNMNLLQVHGQSAMRVDSNKIFWLKQECDVAMFLKLYFLEKRKYITLAPDMFLIIRISRTKRTFYNFSHVPVLFDYLKHSLYNYSE